MRYAALDTSGTITALLDLGDDVAVPDGAASLVCGPPAEVAVGWTLAGGLFAAPLGLADLKAAKAAAVEARRDAILSGGFAHDFGGTVGAKTLQTRPSDQTNWLTVQASCLAAVTAGQGATVGVMIRTADNTNVPLSYSDGLHLMLAMSAWGSQVFAASWSLKDGIAAATDPAALASIDIATGWPAST